MLQDRGCEQGGIDVGALHDVGNATKSAAVFLGQPANVDVRSSGVLENQTHEFPASLDSRPIIEPVGRGVVRHDSQLKARALGASTKTLERPLSTQSAPQIETECVTKGAEIQAPRRYIWLSKRKGHAVAIERIAELLSKSVSPDRVFPPTDLYSEGWMLRLVLDWFNRNPDVQHELGFCKGSGWYSEALLPSAFLARKRGDSLAESWTHADGVIGRFLIGEDGAGDLSLKNGATQFVVAEAKMFSKLSAGVTNAKYFNQAARNVACIAEIAKRAGIAPSSFEDLAFYVVAPKARIDEGVFSEQMDIDAMREVVRRRVSEYEDPEKHQWFDEWFLPTLAAAKIRCISWEEILTVISEHKEADGQDLGEFYAKCLEFNQFVAKRY